MTRRAFLSDVGIGMTGMALGAMLQRDGIVRAAEPSRAGGWLPPDGRPHFAPKAKSVIWLFMIGGASHLESFDPKPALNLHAGKSMDEIPIPNPLKDPLTEKNVRIVVKGDANGKLLPTIYPLQIGYKKHGKSGIQVSDWFPNIASCVDDLAVVRSMWTTDNNHGGQLQFHTGRHRLDPPQPSIGSWVHYGLGSLNDNLPQFVVLGGQLADCCGGNYSHSGDYLGPEHAGVKINIDPKNPLPFASPGAGMYVEEQRANFDLLNRLNRQAAVQYPDDPAMQARIKSYELAFRMQMAVPQIVSFEGETQATRDAYGLNETATRAFGEQCLAARRLVERGVRFVQIYHGYTGNAGAWDSHTKLQANHSKLAGQIDQPVAALIKDLKQRGLLEETLVVWGSEFGRTPGAQNSDGRDHHPYGFSIFMAGGGIKSGVVHGATDELGFHAVTDRHYVTDLHATVMHQMGLDLRRLEVPGRKRLEIDNGEPMHAIIA